MAEVIDQEGETPSNKQREIRPAQRKQILERDGHSCQLCDAAGTEAGGKMPLQVHHKSYNPDEYDVDDPRNLITLCLHCHNWFHNRPDVDTPTAEIGDAAANKLILTDFEIIQILCQDGPLSAKEIRDRISPDQSLVAVKERLWRIMGIDNAVDDQTQLIDQDAKTGEWGLPYQIDSTERRIPDETQEIVQRTVDTLVMSALERGCDRKLVTKVFDLHYRTTYRIQYRGQAYDFPVDMFVGQGRRRKKNREIDQDTPTKNQLESQQQFNNLKTDKENDLNANTASDDDCGDNNIDMSQPSVDKIEQEIDDLNIVDELPDSAETLVERLNYLISDYQSESDRN